MDVVFPKIWYFMKMNKQFLCHENLTNLPSINAEDFNVFLH